MSRPSVEGSIHEYKIKAWFTQAGDQQVVNVMITKGNESQLRDFNMLLEEKGYHGDEQSQNE